MNKHKPLLRGFIVVTVGLLLGAIGFLLNDRNQVPAKAQAQELFTLYFDMDHVRQDSARIFAELIRAVNEPERVGATEAIGSKPPLASRDELIGRLKENQDSVGQTLDTIAANKFTDPEVDLRYDEVQSFYTSLFEFEDIALTELSLAEDNAERQMHLPTVLFEGSDWPALLAKDVHLRETLASLATLHDLEFAPLAYEDLFRERLIELDTPIISDEVNTITYPFTVNETGTYYVLLNISFDIPLSDKMQFTLEDPQGRVITMDQLAEGDDSADLNRLSNIYRDQSVVIIKLYPGDPLVTPIVGDWKLYVTAPVGCTVVFGIIQL